MKVLLVLVQVLHGHLYMSHHLLGLEIYDYRDILLKLLQPTVKQVQHLLLPREVLLEGLSL